MRERVVAERSEAAKKKAGTTRAKRQTGTGRLSMSTRASWRVPVMRCCQSACFTAHKFAALAQEGGAVDRAQAGERVAEVAPEVGVQRLVGVEAEELARDLDRQHLAVREDRRRSRAGEADVRGTGRGRSRPRGQNTAMMKVSRSMAAAQDGCFGERPPEHAAHGSQAITTNPHNGLAKDGDEAARWFPQESPPTRATPGRNANLGKMYERGIGGEDEAEAARQYQEAADQGHVDAMTGLDPLAGECGMIRACTDYSRMGKSRSVRCVARRRTARPTGAPAPDPARLP